MSTKPMSPEELAEKFADECYDRIDEWDWARCRDAHLAGYYSRDAEIAALRDENDLFADLKESAYERAQNYKDCYAPNGGIDYDESALNFLATYMAAWARDYISNNPAREWKR